MCAVCPRAAGWRDHARKRQLGSVARPGERISDHAAGGKDDLVVAHPSGPSAAAAANIEFRGRAKQYVQEGDIIRKGHITVPDRPGIGLTINDEALKKMVRPGSTWFTA